MVSQILLGKCVRDKDVKHEKQKIIKKWKKFPKKIKCQKLCEGIKKIKKNKENKENNVNIIKKKFTSSYKKKLKILQV